MKYAQTEGIFYVYNPTDSYNTFKSMKFPITSSIETTTNQPLYQIRNSG